MLNRKVVLVAVALLFGFAGAASACPGCEYSPHGWGFCKYYQHSGGYDCDTVRVDPWSGRTDCLLCGQCDWHNPDSNRPCDNGLEDCGISTPCDDHALNLSEPRDTCSSATRVGGSSGLSWMDARADQVAIF